MLRVLASSLPLLIATSAAAQDLSLAEDLIDLDDDRYVSIPFEVPEGTRALEVRPRSTVADDVLDFGIWSPNGFRGWSGGTTRPIRIGEEKATAGYLAGPIDSGTWQLVIGTARVGPRPAFAAEVTFDPNMEDLPERKPRVDPPPQSGPRFFAGDLHVHSDSSGDADAPMALIAARAVAEGLDFVVLSDHNTVSQNELVHLGNSDELLFMPGIEVTTYDGHLGALGAETYVDHRLGLGGRTMSDIMRDIRDAGGAVIINHPALDLGDLCIGCAMTPQFDETLVDAVEVTTGIWGGSDLLDFTDRSIALLDELAAKGVEVAAVGGSDDHRAGEPNQPYEGAIGVPVTLVEADALTASAILDAVKRGRTVVKLLGADDPMIELRTQPPAEGQLVRAETVTVRVMMTGAEEGTELRLLVDGEVVDTAIAAETTATIEFDVDAPSEPVDRSNVRAEAIDGVGRRRTITSHVFVTREGAGCECVGGRSTSALGLLLFGLGLVGCKRRQRV